jgi:hypothetical protein
MIDSNDNSSPGSSNSLPELGRLEDGIMHFRAMQIDYERGGSWMPRLIEFSVVDGTLQFTNPQNQVKKRFSATVVCLIGMMLKLHCREFISPQQF